MHNSIAAMKRAGLSRSTASGVLRLAGYEWFRMRRRPAFVVLCVLAGLAILIPAIVAAIVLNLDFFSDANGGEVESVRDALIFSFTPFNAVAMCVGALIFGADFGAGGYRALYARGAYRIAVPLSKVVFVFAVLAGLIVIGWVLTLVVSNIATLVSDGSMYACTDCVESITLSARALLGVAFWSLLGAGLAYWGRSTTLGVGAGFGYYFLSGIVQPALSVGFTLKWDIDLGPYLHWLPENLVGAFFNADSTYIDYWISGVGALAYCAAIAALILWLSRARDIVPPR